MIEKINHDVFQDENLEKEDNVTSCVLSSINYDAKLFTICRAQLVKKVSCD